MTHTASGGRSYSVLVVSSSEKFDQAMSKLLPEARYNPVVFVQSAAEARREMMENPSDLVIINSPLSDETGVRLAADACSDTNSGVMMFVKTEYFSELLSKAAPYGSLVLPKPTSQGAIANALLMLCGIRERFRRIEKKAASVEEKVQEIRKVNRAKMLLIEQGGMTESQAHRHIEKLAMDRCVTKGRIAEDIIQSYTQGELQ